MTKKEEKIFIKKLRKAMAEQYMTQTELAQKLGLSHASISAWLHDKSKPEFSLLEKIAERKNFRLCSAKFTANTCGSGRSNKFTCNSFLGFWEQQKPAGGSAAGGHKGVR